MVPHFKEKLKELNPYYTTFDILQTLQVNLGDRCNLQCSHCHMKASPSGNRTMGRKVMDDIAAFLSRQPGIILDITGGCPEMNPHFRYFVDCTADVPRRRIVRSNLAIMAEPGMEWLPEFYRNQGLVVTASLPCYLQETVDRQRGSGAYEKGIQALKRLNSLGYGDALELNLVHNPAGPFIPASQSALADAYRTELHERHGIRFNNLYILANAPIGRFRDYLEERGAYERYLNKLAVNFNPDAGDSIMCRRLVSVDCNGTLYNCDFNLALGIPITGTDGRPLNVSNIEAATRKGKELCLAQHCYCCTAGEGSSCTGALTS